MNFEDEHYIRIYTRDTKTWLRWGWEGQTVFVLTMRRLDKAGIVDVDDPVEDVALLTGLPVDVVRIGFARVLASKTFEVRAGKLIAPRYIEGQTAAKSDTQRQRESRERRRASARLEVSDSIAETIDDSAVTSRDPVTTGHSPSQVVTQCSALQISTDQIPPNPPVGGEAHDSLDSNSEDDTPSVTADAAKKQRQESLEEAAKRVFECWQAEHGHRGAKYDRKRRSRILARLAEGFSAQELCQAIRGAKRDPFLMGKNDGARVYDELHTLLRDAAQVERLMGLVSARREVALGAVRVGNVANTSRQNHEREQALIAEARRKQALKHANAATKSPPGAPLAGGAGGNAPGAGKAPPGPTGGQAA